MPEPQKIKSEKKPQARGFNPNAMAQAQVLNQQPDSIPAMMKPGEYVLPPDTVAAMGGPQALDAAVAQTHTPTNAGAIVPKGFEPRLFFSGGGLAQEEEQKPKPISPTNIYPQGSPSAGANVYGGAIDAAKSAVSAAANPQGGQPLVKGAAQMFGQRQELQQQGRERWDASVAARQPAPAQPAQPVGLPAATAAPSTAPAVTSGFASAQDGMTNDFGRQPSAPTPMASAAPSTAPAQTPRAQFVADQNAKLEAANTRLAERTAQLNERYKPAPNSPSNTFPGNRMPVESGAASVQPAASAAAPTQPSRGAAGFLADAFPGTTAAVQGSMDDAKEAYRQGGVGALIGTSARVAATPLIGLADDVYSSAAKVVRPVTDTALQAGKTALTGDVSPINPLQHGAGAGQETSTGATSKTPQRSPFNASTAVDSTYGLAPISKPAAQESTPGAEPAQVRGLPGVYQHGKGQYSDNPEGMGFATGFTGQPSAQNMQAANALASQQQAQSMGRVAAQQQAQQQAMQPRGFAAPQIDHSGNSSASKDELRRLRWAAESAMENAPRKKYAMQHPAVLAYQAALQGDTAARYGGQAGLEAKTNDTNAGLQREQMQQQGANQRDAGRLAIDQKRLGLDAQQQQEQSTARGFEIRGAKRKEAAQSAWEKASPEQRSVMKEMYPDLFGDGEKKKSYSFDVVRGSADPVTGKREGDYAVVFDPNTGRYRQVQIGQ